LVLSGSWLHIIVWSKFWNSCRKHQRWDIFGTPYGQLNSPHCRVNLGSYKTNMGIILDLFIMVQHPISTTQQK
jgi:hypothetical protein